MEVNTLEESLSQLRSDAVAGIAAASSLDALDAVKQSVLGKKGKLTEVLMELKDAPPALRPKLGALVNKIKGELESALEDKTAIIRNIEIRSKLDSEWIDVTLPVRPAISSGVGSLHPITQVTRELEEIFRGLGFTVADGPEIESEHYNFDALNMPEHHPARDMQDTFWTKLGAVLRTQTSGVQVREMERVGPPLRIVVPGRVYRYERADATHDHTFYQMEGMVIDREIHIGHLIYFMQTLLNEVLGGEQKIRLRPGFFPFVEPAFELDIWFNNRWLELLPCGLIHPRVLEAGGVDPSKWQGFAFGLGLSRLAMTRFGLKDLRPLQTGDLRFLKQFR